MYLKNKYITITFLFIIFIWISCNTNFIINESKAINNPWKSKNTIGFEFQIPDTISSYSFYMSVRNSTDYNYRNIYFFIHTIFPDGYLSKDTVECILANVRGKWVGNGIGDVKESSHLISNHVHFPRSGLYKIEIEQAMRTNNLTGIRDVGIKIVKNVD